MSTPSTDVSNQLLKGYLFAWVVWGFGAFFYFIAIFQRVAPSVMVSELMRDLGLTGSGLGNMSGIYFWGYALVQLPTGMLVDGWGPRRLLCCSAVICGIGGLLFAFADTSTVNAGAKTHHSPE
jgi:MFS family permease